ncbi:hypothetical protein BaRGS_00035520 [Batillaria attramentaria]|uniref:Uncharacterized protein n=1 Tax=Batillaria attramentaria TaxID=370345 RepID=A0ABD0JEL6_9CAEN
MTYWICWVYYASTISLTVQRRYCKTPLVPVDKRLWLARVHFCSWTVLGWLDVFCPPRGCWCFQTRGLWKKVCSKFVPAGLDLVTSNLKSYFQKVESPDSPVLCAYKSHELVQSV